MKGTGSPAAVLQFLLAVFVSVNEHFEVDVNNSEKENVCETL